MTSDPLLVPFLLDAALPTDNDVVPITSRPTHIVSWSVNCEAGPSKRIALATQDNSIWVLTPSSSAQTAATSAKGKSRPKDQTNSQQSLSPNIPSIRSPTSPTHNHVNFRPRSTARSQSYTRPRAGSSTSSVLSSSSKRRVSAFSPPPSARQLPTTTLSSATATATVGTSDPHTHPRASLSDRTELLEHLREQKDRPKDDSSGLGIGLGIGIGIGNLGIGRSRGLTGVHGKEEEHSIGGSGVTTPKSTTTIPSATNTSTNTGTGKNGDNNNHNPGIFGFWRNSTTTTNEESERDQELREQIQEVQVDLEMERERIDDLREKEDIKIVERAAVKSPTTTSNINIHALAVQENIPELQIDDQATKTLTPPIQLILGHQTRGKIVAMKVFTELDILCILRDEGILDIFSLGNLQRLASINLESPPVEDGKRHKDILTKNKRLSPFWSWKGIHLAKKDDSYLLIAHGLPWPCAMPSPNGEVTRVVMLSINLQGDVSIVARLELPGEGDVGLCKDGEASYLVHATPTSLLSYSIIFPSQPPSQQTTLQPRASPQVRAVSSAFASPILRSSTPGPDSNSGGTEIDKPIRKSASHSHLRDAADATSSSSSPLLGHGPAPVPSDKSEKGFAKFLAARRADWTSRKDKDEKGEEIIEAGLSEGREVDRDGYGHWQNINLLDSGEGVGIAEESVDIFFCNGKSLKVRGTITLSRRDIPRQVLFTPGWQYVIISSTSEHTLIYRLNNDGQTGRNMSFDQIKSFESSRAVSLGEINQVILAQDGSINLHTLDARAESDTLFFLKLDQKESSWTHVVPGDVESLFVADQQGNVHRRTLAALLGGATNDNTADETVADRLDSPITCLKVVSGDTGKSEERYVIAGDQDGVVRIWTTEPFKLCGSWTLFADPVVSTVVLDMPQAGKLRSSLVCTSREGTVGLISLKEMDDLFLIPASRAPLRRIFVGGDDILLVYANGKTRVWNVDTREFRRSTGLDAAEDMLLSGDWAEVILDRPAESGPLRPGISTVPDKSQLGRLLQLDLRELGKWIHGSKNNPHHSPLPVLRSLLSLFLTFGVDEGIDDICLTKLGIVKPVKPVIAGLAGEKGVFDMVFVTGPAVWQISPAMTGLRQMVVVTLLRPFLESPDHERWAADAIAYYTTSLFAIEPELESFAGYYMDTSTDVHQAARMLFAARVGRMPEAEIEAMLEVHQHELPNQQPVSDRFSETAARNLTLLGGIALNKYQSLPPTVLKSIAESVQLYLHESKSAHMGLAIELCSRGFKIWQLHVDPMELLRRLFQLSTNKETTSVSGVGIAAQARLAVLAIATSNAPLFMSTLSMDIRDAKTVQGRTSIMKLCVFMARKKPALLENGLPRIAEAVVKSLDPNIGKMREDVWNAATVILNELVLAFSTIDFHSGTQRLAVGTHEGAVIMYDLKTASRLYVLEPHKSPISALTFSPDGRRLITVSIDQGDVTVWKVGSSLSGFFNGVAGGPPRQGGERGEPFKRIVFTRVGDDPLDSTTALSDVQITWPGARQARVIIKETAMTFET